MIPYTPHPILFSLGPLTFYSYGLMIAIAFFAALLVLLKEAKRKKIDETHVYNLWFWIIISSIIGARFFHIITNFSEYKSPIDMLKIWEGGLVFYGGLISGIIAMYIYTKKNKISFWKTADALIIAVPLAQAIGRIGCFLRGCCYGTITNLPWAVDFGDGVLRHPTQLYSAVGNLLIFAYLWKERKKKRFDGSLFFKYVMIYAAFRFLIEFLRENPRYFCLTIPQYISIAIFFISVIIYKKIGGKK